MSETPFEVVRYGKVSFVDYKKGTARVVFEDRDDSVSPELPVMQKNTLNNKFYWMPEVDETAICLYLANGQETGVIIGTIYSEVDRPPTEKKEDGVWFEDGTFVKYEHETKTLSINCAGKIEIHADEEITITSNRTVTTIDSTGGGTT